MTLSRVPSRAFSESIGRALNVVHGFAEHLTGVQFLCGVDPVFAGLHPFDRTPDGRRYGETAHCTYSHLVCGPADRRVTTVVLPVQVSPHVVVHELGHALHERIGFEGSSAPVTEYAATDRWEAFAEAFTAWHYRGYGDEAVLLGDQRSAALFEKIGGPRWW